MARRPKSGASSDKTAIAKILDVSRSTLYHSIKTHKIAPG